MPVRREIEPGSKFGSWTVLGVSGSGNGGLIYHCRCECAAQRYVPGSTLRSGKSTKCVSCSAKLRSRKHGGCGTPEYRAWQHMISRCSGSYHRSRDYAERGIGVTEEWLGEGGFSRFLAHIGPRPSRRHSVDRIDNDRGYEPGNVRWATRRDQQRNMRSNLRLTIDGVSKCLAAWSEESPVNENTIYYRLKRGWPARDAVFGRRQQGKKGPRLTA